VAPGLQKGKVIGAIILGMLWICCFLFISPTLIIDFGAGITLPFKDTVIFLGLLTLFIYHLVYRSNPETTKLSWTAVFTIAWLALIWFYPFRDPKVDEGTRGAVAFFTLVGGLAVCLIWVRFFSDEITA
jgi:hypothetical protein